MPVAGPEVYINQHQPPAQRSHFDVQADPRFAFHNISEWQQPYAPTISRLDRLPRQRTKFGRFGTEGTLPAKAAYTPAPDTAPAQLPIWSLVFSAIPIAGGVGVAAGAYDLYRGGKDDSLKRRVRGTSIMTLSSLACGAGGIATFAVETAPVAAEVLTVQSVENAVKTWNDFHITDGVQNFHLNRTGVISPSVENGNIVTAPFALKGKDGWVYTLADSVLLTVDINGDRSAKGVGTLTTPSHFLVAHDPKTGETVTHYLLPQALEDHFTALQLNKDGVGVLAGFQFIHTQGENGDVFSIWEDGAPSPVQTPIIEQNVDTFVNISFKPVNNTFPTPSAEVASTPSPTVMEESTAIPTPTEIPDPNKPPDATGRDEATGYYTKTAEDGVTKLYGIPSNPENPSQVSWFKSNMANGPIYLVDSKINRYGVPDTMPYYFFSRTDTNLATVGLLSHPDISDQYKDGIDDEHQLTVALSNKLLSQIYWHFYPSGSAEDTTEHLNSFMSEFATDKTGKYIISVQAPKDVSSGSSETNKIQWNPADGAQAILVDPKYFDGTKDAYHITSPLEMWIQYTPNSQPGPLRYYVGTTKMNLDDKEKNILATVGMWLALRFPTLPPQFASLSNIRYDGNIVDIDAQSRDLSTQAGLSAPFIEFGK